jgi:hypothetical protein
MVQAVAAGESITEIARKEELSRAWVTRELDSGECRHLLTELMNNERAQVHKLFKMTLTVIEDALQAEKDALVDKKWVTRADHPTRLTAAKRFMDLSSIGRAMPESFKYEPKTTISWQQFLVMYEARKKEQADGEKMELESAERRRLEKAEREG